MDAELKVVAGGNAGATFRLQQRPHHLVLHQDGGKLRVALDGPESEGPRLVEVHARLSLVRIKVLRAGLGVLINGEHAVEVGERAALQNGDVLTIGNVALRCTCTPSLDESIEASGSYRAVPSPDLSATAEIVAVAEPTESGRFAMIGEVDEGRLAKHAECLKAVAEAALSIDDAKALLGRGLEVIGAQFGAASGAVLWRAGDSNQFGRVARLRATANELRVSPTVLRRVLDSRAAVLSKDSWEDDLLKRDKTIATKGIRSLLCVPILRDGEVKGVIHLDHTGLGKFDEADLSMVGAVASILASALDALERRSKVTEARINAMLDTELRAAALAAGAEAGVRIGGIELAADAIEQTTGCGVFADALLQCAPGEAPSGAIDFGVGALLGDAAAVAGPSAAIMARTVVRSMSAFGLDPETILGEIVSVLGSTGLCSEGSALVGHLEPDGILAIAAAGRPPLIHVSAQTGQASIVTAPRTLSGSWLVEPERGPVAALDLEIGDTLVVVADSADGNGSGSRAQELVSLRDLVAAEVAGGPAALVARLVRERCGYLQPGRSAAVLAMRRVES